jgi:hypothetical protein
VIRGVAVAIVLAAAVLVGAAPVQAADECKGLKTCIPVAGPWVAIPAPGGVARATSWRLVCPTGVVGGVDARASEQAVTVEFPGRLGSPVNPGITTGPSLVFRGTYAGRTARVTSYRPFIGCIPTAGGGPRTRTSFQRTSAVKPGYPITVRVTSLEVLPGILGRATVSCHEGERVLRSFDSVGLYTVRVPSAAELAAVHVIRARRGQKVLISATRRGLPGGIRAVVQVLAECAT